ncbi:MAG: type IX secretion system membrane protein PorP/SprF [Chitinophagales bacterium]|nr:type IX secretion system membrane protein PorP/SprF [Chitinophagales bacterium]
MLRYVYMMVLILASILIGNSQQWPVHSQYMLNKYRDNPAYGGLDRSLSVFTSYRDQYNSLNGNPKTLYLGANLPFYIWNGAVGFSFYNQQAGIISNNNIKVSYNYVAGTPVGFLSFGGRVGVDMVNFRSSGIITPDGDYEGTINHHDPYIENNTFNGTGLSWELGAYFYGSNIEAGLVLSDVPEHSYRIGSGQYVKSLAVGLFAQYKYQLSDDINIRPSLFIRADKAVLQTDIGGYATFRNDILLGFNLRGYSNNSLDAASLIVGTNIGKKYFLTYSYDFGLSRLRSYHQGSHEIMLSYNLQKLIGLGLPPRIIYNPRDL